MLMRSIRRKPNAWWARSRALEGAYTELDQRLGPPCESNSLGVGHHNSMLCHRVSNRQRREWQSLWAGPIWPRLNHDGVAQTARNKR